MDLPLRKPAADKRSAELAEIKAKDDHRLDKAELRENASARSFGLRLRKRRRVENQRLADTVLDAQVTGTRTSLQFKVEKSFEYRALTLGRARRQASWTFLSAFTAFSAWSTVNVQDAAVRLMGGAEQAPNGLETLAWGLEPGLALIVGGVIYFDDKIANADGRIQGDLIDGREVRKGLGKRAHQIKWSALVISLALSLFAHWPEKLGMGSISIMILNALGAIMAAVSIWLLTMVTHAVREARPDLGADSIEKLREELGLAEDEMEKSSHRSVETVTVETVRETAPAVPAIETVEPSHVLPEVETAPVETAPVETVTVSPKQPRISSHGKPVDLAKRQAARARAQAQTATAVATVDRPKTTRVATAAKAKAVADIFEALLARNEKATTDSVFKAAKAEGLDVSRATVGRYLTAHMRTKVTD